MIIERLLLEAQALEKTNILLNLINSQLLIKYIYM